MRCSFVLISTTPSAAQAGVVVGLAASCGLAVVGTTLSTYRTAYIDDDILIAVNGLLSKWQSFRSGAFQGCSPGSSTSLVPPCPVLAGGTYQGLHAP